MKDTKIIKDDKKEKESPELKEELTEDELKGVSGGATPGGLGLKSADGVVIHGGVGISDILPEVGGLVDS